MFRKSTWTQSDIEKAERVKQRTKESVRLATRILNEMSFKGTILFCRFDKGVSPDDVVGEYRPVDFVSVKEGVLRLHYRPSISNRRTTAANFFDKLLLAQ
jgi:hypothetical protein